MDVGGTCWVRNRPIKFKSAAKLAKVWLVVNCGILLGNRHEGDRSFEWAKRIALKQGIGRAEKVPVPAWCGKKYITCIWHSAQWNIMPCRPILLTTSQDTVERQWYPVSPDCNHKEKLRNQIMVIPHRARPKHCWPNRLFATGMSLLGVCLKAGLTQCNWCPDRN